MELNKLVSYLWLQQAFFALTYPHTKDRDLLEMIKNGNLAYELIRPQDFYLKFYIKLLSTRIIAALLRSLPIIVVGFLLPEPYKLCLPVSLESFVLFVFSLLMATLLVTALSLIIHITTMYILDYRGIFAIVGTVIDIFMGAIIPLPFFPDWLLKIAYILPFRYIADFPYRVYSGDISILEGRTLLIKSIIWVIIMIIFGYFLSKRALRKAVIQGG
jgi:ABC-2 type transport system permease protein